LPPERSAPLPPLPDVVLGPADHASTQQLALHQRLLLRLPEVPTSGYRWQGADALAAGDALRFVSSDYEPPSPRATGGQGMLQILFEARAPGRTALRLRQVRSGGSGAPAGQFALDVQVNA
jgi:predicted secreted protein